MPLRVGGASVSGGLAVLDHRRGRDPQGRAAIPPGFERALTRLLNRRGGSGRGSHCSSSTTAYEAPNVGDEHHHADQHREHRGGHSGRPRRAGPREAAVARTATRAAPGTAAAEGPRKRQHVGPAVVAVGLDPAQDHLVDLGRDRDERRRRRRQPRRGELGDRHRRGPGDRSPGGRSTAASPCTSARSSTPPPRACSGAMYAGVPTTWVSPLACIIALATPRSATINRSARRVAGGAGGSAA